ncbi:hypothetical protein QPK24_17575 [Paenibacillus polygoni]|uniref:Uncharacterized protein n=1 Tax=Paenibacillus polygoni TaxID=3050112 RepID=A0ABY8WYF6_9BACL|nr:hypothetical protein [Paenibacillus polygoni]WIV18197.1 hypothetical protein QPK24_17575 [Paenibacillus polygoni]
MNKEAAIAIKRNQEIIVKSKNGETISGFPVETDHPSRLILRTTFGPVWIPYEEVEQVTRILSIKRSKKSCLTCTR